MATGSHHHLSIAFVLQPRFTLLAFSSFIDALRLAADEADRSRPLRCSWDVLSHDMRPIRASCGIEITPTREIADPAGYDYVVMVGGLLPDGRRLAPKLLTFLKQTAEAGVPLIGVCTGSFILARLGLMQGYRSCVSWFHANDFGAEFPEHVVTSNEIFVTDRNRITCAGGTGVIHLAAHLIERHVSRPEAQKALRIMLENVALPSRALQPQPTFAGRSDNVWIRKALLLMERNVSTPLPMDAIARELHLSTRQLERLFQSEIGSTPADFAVRLRLRHAHDLLLGTRRPISEVALESGFADCSHFSRRFRGQYGKTPTQIRAAGLADPGDRRVA